MVLKSARNLLVRGAGGARQLKRDHPAGPKRGYCKHSHCPRLFQEVLGVSEWQLQHRHCVCQDGATSPEIGAPRLARTNGRDISCSPVLRKNSLRSDSFDPETKTGSSVKQAASMNFLMSTMSLKSGEKQTMQGGTWEVLALLPRCLPQSRIKLQALKVTQAGMGLANVRCEINTKNSQDGVPHKQPDILSQPSKKSRISVGFEARHGLCNLRIVRMGTEPTIRRIIVLANLELTGADLTWL